MTISYKDDINSIDKLVKLAETLIEDNVPVLKRSAVILQCSISKLYFLTFGNFGMYGSLYFTIAPLFKSS